MNSPVISTRSVFQRCPGGHRQFHATNRAVHLGGIPLAGNVKFAGNLAITDALAKGSGTFVIDHPLAPRTMLLYHSFVESPDAKNLYDGIATLDKNGEVVIQLPSYFDALNKDPRYQFFPHYQPMPNLYIKEEEHDNRFTIAGGAPHGEISWQVTGIRKDPYILANPLSSKCPKVPANQSTAESASSNPFADSVTRNRHRVDGHDTPRNHALNSAARPARGFQYP